MTEAASRDEICRIGRSLFERGYVHATAGNISIRLDDGFLITPTDACLGSLDPGQLARMDSSGVQISGDKATVFVKLPNETQAQEISLIKVASQWIIGDRETQKLLKSQGRNYFFNERIRVSEAEANEWLQEILGAQLVYFKAKQRYIALDELIKLGGVSPQLANGAVSGYRFAVAPSQDGQSFVVTAVPVTYGRTGRLSFYADQTNLIRAEDKNGQPATASAKPYAPNKN